MRVLLLGGTGEARALAAGLVEAGHAVVSSLAGRVRDPRLPVGEVRVGGFGGVAGLRAELAGFDAVVDATHPFAAVISANAAAACAAEQVPLLRLARPGWCSLPGADRWRWVGTSSEASAAAAAVGGPVLLTTGRQSLEEFVPALASASVLVRVVDPVQVELPTGWRVLQARGPYSLEGETALMTEQGTSVLVTKDSGGDLTRPKLDAADALGVAVVVVRRPEPPDGVAQVGDVAGAVAWVDALTR